MLHGNHTLPLSFTICRLRQLESVTPGPPAPPGHVFHSAQAPRLLNASTCQPWPGSLSLPAEHSQPALLPGLGQPPHGPGAHSYSRATSHVAPAPTETLHSGPMETSASLLPRSLGSAWGQCGLFGVCGMQRMLSFSGNSESRPHCLFWPLSADAAGFIQQGGLPPALIPPRVPSSKRSFRFQRNEVSALRGSSV